MLQLLRLISSISHYRDVHCSHCIALNMSVIMSSSQARWYIYLHDVTVLASSPAIFVSFRVLCLVLVSLQYLKMFWSARSVPHFALCHAITASKKLSISHRYRKIQCESLTNMFGSLDAQTRMVPGQTEGYVHRHLHSQTMVSFATALTCSI